MIQTVDEFDRTHAYIERLQIILLGLCVEQTASGYEWMSKPYLAELMKAQREIALFLAVPQATHRIF